MRVWLTNGCHIEGCQPRDGHEDQSAESRILKGLIVFQSGIRILDLAKRCEGQTAVVRQCFSLMWLEGVARRK